MTIRDIIKEFPELYDFDYKWIDSNNYIDLNEALENIGYKLIESEIAGEYNDIKAYLECEIIKV